MADAKKTVMVDTTFLITLANPKYPNYDVANRYYKYMLGNDIKMHLSAIVIAEYHQLVSAAEWLSSGNFIPMPFNIYEATHLSNVAHNLGSTARIDARNDSANDGTTPRSARAEFKDDLKLIAQAEKNKIDYIITEDASTLAKQLRTLHAAGLTEVQPIVVADGFDSSWFTGGQKSLLD